MPFKTLPGKVAFNFDEIKDEILDSLYKRDGYTSYRVLIKLNQLDLKITNQIFLIERALRELATEGFVEIQSYETMVSKITGEGIKAVRAGGYIKYFTAQYEKNNLEIVQLKENIKLLVKFNKHYYLSLIISIIALIISFFALLFKD